MSDDMPITLARLPLFATDAELARAIVGPERATEWRKSRMPALNKLPGFPKVDAFHGGRPVALVWKFYRHYLGIDKTLFHPDGPEGTWSRKSRRKP